MKRRKSLDLALAKCLESPMTFLVQWLYNLALALWVGGMVFFSFITTPTIFQTLPREMASQIISAIFPRYYVLGYASGGMLLVCALIESILKRGLPLPRRTRGETGERAGSRSASSSASPSCGPSSA